MKNKFLMCICVLLIGLPMMAQELDLTVKVTAPTNSIADPKVFNGLEKEIYEFFNQTQWTDKTVENFEKIKGNLQITITNVISANTFVADVIIQTSRPVFNATYETRILNYIDKGLNFTYNPGQPIQRSEQAFYDNLSSSLTFYAYAILGADYDSFSLYGGDKFWLVTRDIINTLPLTYTTSDVTWDKNANPGKNKYWMSENMLSPKVRPFRQAFYEYHRLGLDKMWEDSDRQRAVVSSAISMLEEVNSAYPNCMALQMFADSKKSEIIEIFKVGDKGQKLKIFNILVAIDPAQASTYEILKR